ncbi:MAG: anthranilate synthase component I family protein, partial [Phycisphaeraceae bacterium]|nr:anthranilate synthase component I family protein [Phycisphaeraceae bacterium]
MPTPARQPGARRNTRRVVARRLDWSLSPLAALDRWPEDVPLAALWSDGPVGPESRWVVLARPAETIEPRSVEDLERLTRWTALGGGGSDRAAGAQGGRPPFVGGWIGLCAYGLGRELEPAAALAGRPRPGKGEPRMVWQRCAAAYCYDRVRRRWWVVGREAERAGLPDLVGLRAGAPGRYRVGSLRSVSGRRAYERAVARALEYIRAGDVFQVNLAHRLEGSFAGSTRALWRRAVEAARPRFGVYVRWPGACVVSVSPELFVAMTPRGEISTRPMKGTRPAGGSARELAASGKDRAELNMIVDLMRNDLGKVAATGSVRVAEARRIERHGRGGAGVLQATALVTARLRAGVGLAGVLRAAFPGGSVTGAPKIRAMQIIEELEPVARGVYCGAAGYVSDDGHAALNVAIRTAEIRGRDGAGGSAMARGARLHWSVGAGIVADSDPAAEWRETLDKAGVVMRL